MCKQMFSQKALIIHSIIYLGTSADNGFIYKMQRVKKVVLTKF